LSGTKLILSTLITGLAAFGSTALAQQPQTNNPSAGTAPQTGQPAFARRGMRRQARVGRLRALQELNLTEAQKQQVRTIIQSQAQSTQAQRAELRQLRQQYRAGTLTPESQARAQELRAQLRDSRKGGHTQVMNVLTAEQKAKLRELREARRANHEKFGRRKPPAN